jgi:early secretory antigenic target protein ESAT-6
MSGEVRVTFGEIEAGRTNVAQTANSVQQTLDDLKQFLAPLVATYTGAAAEAWQVKQGEWDRAAADIQQVLANIGVALGTANDAYRQAESANAQRWS